MCLDSSSVLQAVVQTVVADKWIGYVPSNGLVIVSHVIRLIRIVVIVRTVVVIEMIQVRIAASIVNQ